MVQRTYDNDWIMDLLDKDIVGLMQHYCEYGPDFLDDNSRLISPDCPLTRDQINALIAGFGYGVKVALLELGYEVD